MDEENSEKRRATRAALITAARNLIFERGYERISIQDITNRAEVSTGTYYNYFETKQAIFFAVADSMQRELADEIEATRAGIKDPAMIVSVTLKYYFYQSLDNEEWREFTHCAGLGDLPLLQPSDECAEDIQRGVKAGRFRVDDIHFTQNLITGMTEHVSREISKGALPRSGVDFAIRSILQMLGLPDLVSKALTQTPLPPMAAPRRRSRTSGSEVTSLADYATGSNRRKSS